MTFALVSEQARNIARLEAQLQHANEKLAKLPPEPAPVHRLRGCCIFCGHGPTRGWPATCRSHRDLPAVDPHYGATL